jgi:hypothetical protein
MKTFSRKDKMDEMEPLKHDGWDFLCSGEQLPSGEFQAVVRHKTRPSEQIRTLVLDAQLHATAKQALERAKELALGWAEKHAGDGLGHA